MSVGGPAVEARSPHDGAPEWDALRRLTVVAPEAALADLRSTDEGLSGDEVAARFARIGPNELPKADGPGLVRQLLDQLLHFFALMLWVAASLAFVGDMPQLGSAIIVVILVNGVFSFAQEYRAERAVRALSALLPETAVVRRGSRKLTIRPPSSSPGTSCSSEWGTGSRRMHASSARRS
jgi:magnesium-transporting ATPase (P-type)